MPALDLNPVGWPSTPWCDRTQQDGSFAASLAPDAALGDVTGRITSKTLMRRLSQLLGVSSCSCAGVSFGKE